MSTRAWIAVLLFMQINAVLFGLATWLVLSVPALAEHAMILLPVVVALSFILGAALAWAAAPRMRLRYWRARGRQPRAVLK